MKTTVEIPDPLLREAKRYAAARDLTLREVLETSLRKLLTEEKTRPFRLKRCAFQGDGLVQPYSWPEIRRIAYEGRGE